MNYKTILAVMLLVTICNYADAQTGKKTNKTDGDWNLNYINMLHTPQARQMVRYGDVDNLGFGWKNLDPFAGDITPPHTFPWERDIKDSLGFDMVMVTQSTPFTQCEGYSKQKNPLLNTYGRSVFELKFPLHFDSTITIRKIMFQVFVDDIQTSYRDMHYKVYINHRRAEFVEAVVGKLDQSGSIGKLITCMVPADFFPEFKKEELSFIMDDSSSNLCEGYAIDFIKILYNPVSYPKGDVKFIVRDEKSEQRLALSSIHIPGLNRDFTTDRFGKILVKDLPAGYLPVQVSSDFYRTGNNCIDVHSGKQQTAVIYLTSEARPEHVRSNSENSEANNLDISKDSVLVSHVKKGNGLRNIFKYGNSGSTTSGGTYGTSNSGSTSGSSRSSSGASGSSSGTSTNESTSGSNARNGSAPSGTKRR